MCAPGTVFRPNADPDFHRWVIISKEHKGRVLMVSITDRTKMPDHSCLIDVGDHGSITKPSAVYYKKAITQPFEGVKKAIAAGSGLTIYEDCSPELLARIIQGALRSEDLSEHFLEYLK
jgi:hypothetical protein